MSSSPQDEAIMAIQDGNYVDAAIWLKECERADKEVPAKGLLNQLESISMLDDDGMDKMSDLVEWVKEHHGLEDD